MYPRKITHKGESLTILQWAERIGVSAQVIRYRLNAGWPLDDALTKPRGNRGQSLHWEAINVERKRSQRKRSAELAKLQANFMGLAHEIDSALRAFHHRLSALTDDTPGAVEEPSENANDRPPRVAEECA